MQKDIDKIKTELEEMPHKVLLQNSTARLRTQIPYYNGLREAPSDVKQDSPAGVVFFNLQVCHKNQNDVSEGIIEDVVWGFRQSGIPADITWEGFKELKRLGYLYFHDGTGAAIIGEPNEKLWYRWTIKYIDLLLGRCEKATDIDMVEKIKPKDKDWKEL